LEVSSYDGYYGTGERGNKIRDMPIRLITTTISKIAVLISNPTNASIIDEFYQYMKDNSTSESYQNINLKDTHLQDFSIGITSKKCIYVYYCKKT
jgi:hypothetical protein